MLILFLQQMVGSSILTPRFIDDEPLLSDSVNGSAMFVA
jgi:hypothetical protein